MINKEKAIEIIQSNMNEHKDINLSVNGGTATWKTERELTSVEWKHIGYVSALAFAFDIEEM